MGNTQNESHETGVSNNKTNRAISDALDAIPGFKNSKLRAQIHDNYHEKRAKEKEKEGNYEGAAAERSRKVHVEEWEKHHRSGSSSS